MGCCGSRPINYERLPLHAELQSNYESKVPSQQQLRERALLNARFFLRSHPTLELHQQCNDVGTRHNKHWFRVKDNSGKALLLEMIPVPDECSFRLESENSRYALSQIVCGMRSHFVFPSIQAEVVADKKLLLVVREVNDKGSLRDLLYGARWRDDAERKYGGRGRPFSDKRVATWGRHILEGLNYLALKGIPAGHVHSGNVIVHHNVCRITGYENALVNVKPTTLALVKSGVAKRRSLEPNVVCFGALLFEMATGYEMDKVDLEDAPRNLHPAIEDALGLIFYDGDTGPSIEDLLELPLFRDVDMPDLPPVRKIKLGNRAKELLRRAQEESIVKVHGLRKKKKKSRSNRRYQDSALSTTQYEKRTSTAVVKQHSDDPAVAATQAETPAPAPAATSAPAPPPQPKRSAAPKPPPAPKKPAASKKSAPPPKATKAPKERGALLGSIQGFSKGALKKTVTVDKSKPLI